MPGDRQHRRAQVSAAAQRRHGMTSARLMAAATSATRSREAAGGSAVGSITATKSAPARASASAASAELDVEGDARHLEDLGPPGDQVGPPGASLVEIGEVERRAEGDILGAVLGHRHGVVARDAGVHADDAARPKMRRASA